jgi:hypothetical protein
MTWCRTKLRFCAFAICSSSTWLSKAIFAAVAALLEERRLLLRSGTIVDATIIAAPSSTKNATATRDPE